MFGGKGPKMAIVAEHGLRVNQSTAPSAQDLSGGEMALSYNRNVYASRCGNLVDRVGKRRQSCSSQLSRSCRQRRQSAVSLKYYR